MKAARVQREASEAAEVKKAEDAFGSEIQVEACAVNCYWTF